MMGETSMLATRTTELFSANPIAAIMLQRGQNLSHKRTNSGNTKADIATGEHSPR